MSEENLQKGMDITADDSGNIENNSDNSDDEGINQDEGLLPKHEAKKDEGQNDFAGAPETYDFKDLKMPEGYQLDEVLAKEFEPIGKELNLSQQSANKLAQLLIKYQQSLTTPEKIAQYESQKQNAIKMSYEKMLNEDKEIGGGDSAKMNAYLDVADVGYNSFAGDELKTLLTSLSLDYHPAVIKHFYRLGKLCGNDTVTKAKAPVANEMTPAQILFGSKED